jgi:hypothetical protein
VYGFSILQEDNPQILVVRLGNLRPSPYTPICLDFFPIWVVDNVLNPCKFNVLSVITLACVKKILRIFHTTIGDLPDVSSLPTASKQYAAVSTMAVPSTP